MSTAITDEINAVESVKKQIESRLGSQKYKVWFENSTSFELCGNSLKIEVPNLFTANWIESRFSDEIAEALKEVTGNGGSVSFTIDPAISGHQRKARTGKSPGTKQKRNINTVVRKPKKNAGNGLKLSLDTFVVGSSNELAYNAARAVINDDKNSFNPLFIHGGYGVGKTHLLQGICNAVCQRRPQTNWLYLSAEDFANQFVLALKTRKLEAFRRRMRKTDLLAIDDIHFLASKPGTQEEFLHTFNTIDLAGKQVVMVSDAHPKQIGQISEKLVSRFVSGMVVKIGIPDYKTRCQICRQYMRRHNKELSEVVISYVAETVKTNVRELEGAMLKIFAFASLQNSRITVAMAREALIDHLARTDPIVHISDIESAVSGFFNINPSDLHSSKKNRTVSLARHFSMYLARKHTNMSSSEVGRFMGGKNHATVLMAYKKIEQSLKSNKPFNWKSSAGNRLVKACTILNELEETIRR